MGPLARIDVTGAVLLALVVLVLTALTVYCTVLLRAARAQRVQLAAELHRSRSEVRSLSRRVEELSADVDLAGRVAAQDREYVITSLAGADEAGPSPRGQRERASRRDAGRGTVGRAMEDQLVQSLAHHQGRSRVREQAVELVVRTVSIGHGVRRALTADNRDRAAAEAHLARRRSRRTRRRELREARRLLRVVRTQGDEDVA